MNSVKVKRKGEGLLKTKETRMYNPELKSRYLENVQNEEMRRLTGYTFINTFKEEQNKNLDLFEMSLKEIEEVMYKIEPSTAPAAYNHMHRIERYIDWTIAENIREDKRHPFKGLKRFEWGKKFISNSKNKAFTRDEALEMCEELVNWADRALIMALFEGIRGKEFSELLNLRMKDIAHTVNGYVATLTDIDGSKRTISISEELYTFLYATDKETEYISNNGGTVAKRTPPMKYESSPYIFKKINRGVQGGRLNAHFVNRKFMIFKDIFDIKYLKATHLEVSGMMDMLNHLIERDGKFKSEHIHMIANHYNTPKLHNSENRNYTVALNKINAKTFEKMYEHSINED